MTVASPSSSQHIALGWLIRGTNALLAVLLTAFLCLIAVSFLLLLLTWLVSLFLPTGLNSHRYDAVPVVLALGMAILFVRYSRIGRDAWVNVNKDSARVFVLLFAYLIARDFYYSLPLQLPKSINDHLWIIFQSHDGDRGAYRFIWSMIIFFLFRHLIKSWVTRAFDLEGTARETTFGRLQHL